MSPNEKITDKELVAMSIDPGRTRRVGREGLCYGSGFAPAHNIPVVPEVPKNLVDSDVPAFAWVAGLI